MCTITRSGLEQVLIPLNDDKPRKRVKRGQRRALIIEGARRIFAQQGLSASTRDIAAELGVTQALLYKYFESKDALIEAILAQEPDVVTLPARETLEDTSRSLEDRLSEVSTAILNGYDEERLRLSLFAGLAGIRAPFFFGPVQLRSELLEPIIAALRLDCGLEPLSSRPLCAAEFDLAMVLYGKLVCVAMRDLVYRIQTAQDRTKAMDQLARVWCTGARPEICAIHESWDAQEPVTREALHAKRERLARTA